MEVIELAGELEWGGAWRYDQIAALYNTLTDEELLLREEKGSTWWRCHEDYWNDKRLRMLQQLSQWKQQQQSFRGLTQVLKVLWVKSQTAFHATEKSWKRVNMAGFIVVLLRYRHSYPPTFSNHHPDKSTAINIKVRLPTSNKVITHWRFRWWLAIFSNK